MMIYVHSYISAPSPTLWFIKYLSDIQAHIRIHIVESFSNATCLDGVRTCWAKTSCVDSVSPNFSRCKAICWSSDSMAVAWWVIAVMGFWLFQK